MKPIMADRPITARPQRVAFRPDRLFVPAGAEQADWIINDITIGGSSSLSDLTRFDLMYPNSAVSSIHRTRPIRIHEIELRRAQLGNLARKYATRTKRPTPNRHEARRWTHAFARAAAVASDALIEGHGGSELLVRARYRSRGERIRTSDTLVPNRRRNQIIPHGCGDHTRLRHGSSSVVHAHLVALCSRRAATSTFPRFFRLGSSVESAHQPATRTTSLRRVTGQVGRGSPLRPERVGVRDG